MSGDYDVEYHEYLEACEHEILYQIDWDSFHAKMERAKTLSHEELLGAYRREMLWSQSRLVMLNTAITRLADLQYVTSDSVDEVLDVCGEPSAEWYCQHINKRPSPAEVKKKLVKGLGYKKTRTPDLEFDRKVLVWITVNPLRTWPQAGDEFLGDPNRGKHISGNIHRNYRKGHYNSDPHLLTLYKKLESQKKPGRKKQ
jgi:hypothetical protein